MSNNDIKSSSSSSLTKNNDKDIIEAEIVNEKIELKMTCEDTPITDVTVFSQGNRAEITRKINFIPEKLGNYTILIQGITKHLDEDTIRLSGFGNNIIILNVSHEPQYIQDPKETKSKKLYDKFNEKLKEKQLEKREIEEEKERLRNSVQLTESYINGLILPNQDTNLMQKIGVEGGITSLESFQEALNLFNEEQNVCNEKIDELNEQLNKLNEKITFLQNQISTLPYETKIEDFEATMITNSYDILIMVDVIESIEPIELLVKYMVDEATWKPSYDLRVKSEDEKMELTYFGEIEQHTEEDWYGISLTLSTASPFVGGAPPALKTKSLSLSTYCQPEHNWQQSKVKKSKGSKNMKKSKPQKPRKTGLFGKQMIQQQEMIQQSNLELDYDFSDESGSDDEEEEKLSRISNGSNNTLGVGETDGGSKGLGNANFLINENVTILSQKKSQQVIITVVSLKPSYLHYTVPSLQPDAFLQARTKNKSNYVFLPSNKVSVFFDNSFVAKTEMQYISPGEEFQAFLGVDPQVIVDYRPPKKMSSTQGGFISTKTSKVKHKNVCFIRNSKSYPIIISVVSSFPVPGDNDIKIKLENPEMKNIHEINGMTDEEIAASKAEEAEKSEGGDNNEFPTINVLNEDTHNIIQIKKLNSHQGSNFEVSFSLEFPASKEIRIT